MLFTNLLFNCFSVTNPLPVVLLLHVFFIFSVTIRAQSGTDSSGMAIGKVAFSSTPLFKDDDILTFKLVGNIRTVLNDRGDNPVYHPMTLYYKPNDTSEILIPLKTRVRGNFRRDKANCSIYPPLLLNFPKNETTKSTIFEGQDKIKLVTPCRGDDLVIREYLVYKLYNLVTEKSFKARLAKVYFEDVQKKTKTISAYCILLEDENELAQRNQMFHWNRKGIRIESTNQNDFLKMAIFQFMIGNTDWSVPYLHNIKLITADSAVLPCTVPYDFDHSGIVDAPYAYPALELGITSVRERLYRGYCLNDMNKFDDVFSLYNRLKDDVYNVYTKCTLLDASYIKTTIRYLDDFYRIINSAKAARTALEHQCRSKTNVVIKGLNN